MKNKMSDLNNHLFAELERLSDESLTGEDLNSEIKRALAIDKVSQSVIRGNELILKAAALVSEMPDKGTVPGQIVEMIGLDNTRQR